MAGKVETETREEPREKGQEEGKTPEASPASDGLAPGDDKILSQFKNRLSECKTAQEVQRYMKEIHRERTAMRLSDGLISKMSTLANDRLRELLKSEK
jgi:hypothetical protein